MPEETWRPVVGFEGLYEVSDLGRVRSWRAQGSRSDRKLEEPVIKALHPNERGYLYVNLCRAGRNYSRRVHCVVIEAFIGPRPKGMQVRHLNDIKTDNRLVNLAYGTPEQNRADAIRNDRIARGERHYASVLRESDVEQIRSLNGGMLQREIAAMFGVTPQCISHIVTGRRWKVAQ